MWKFGIVVLSVVCFANATNRKAIAVLRNPANGIDGTVTFEEVGDGVLITGKITGLKAGKHGFHIHEKGDVSDPKCTSAGGHFNPYKKNHGAPEDEERHVGDLGNIEVTEDVASFSFTDKVIKFEGEAGILNRSVVIHDGEDDLGKGGYEDSLTTGHAGARLACGVIKNNARIVAISSGLLILVSTFSIFL